MKILKTRRAALVVILGVAICLVASTRRGQNPLAASAAAGTQDISSLDRRISSLERRLDSIESGINRLELQARLSQRTPTSPASGRDLEINLLRTEIETLRRSLVEIECGLVKLDERTASAAAREARRRMGAGGGTDPCRLNAEAPLRLPSRP